MEEGYERAAKAMELMVEDEISQAMNLYNGNITLAQRE